jgi:hypothetical protein
MNNAKHIQGVCNNLIMSLTEHPGNYFRFWSHLYLPEIDIDLKLNLLADNNYPKYLSGEACSDIQSTIIEYRGFFLNHLDKYKINKEEINVANILIKTDRKKDKMIIFEAKFVVRTEDGKIYEASTTPSFWGNEENDI